MTETRQLPSRAYIVVRDRSSAVALAPLLADTGIALEVTCSIPESAGLIAELTAAYDGLVVVAGTVTDPDAARAAAAAGATAIISPHLVAELPAAVDVPTILGALTPTEVTTAAAGGAAAVKVFPVSAVGGASYIRALRGPYPSLPLVPSGGIGLDDVADYFDAGAVAVALGSRAITSGDPRAAIDKLRAAVAAA